MKLMAWSDHFVTGISAVDAQHHALVDMVNTVAPSLSLGDEEAGRLVAPLLDKLVHYADVHFKYEEALMARTQVLPEYLAQHHRTHEAFVHEVLQMRQQYEQFGNLSGKELLQFLISWLTFHILSEDKRMASQVQAIQAGDTPEHAFAALGPVGGAPNAVYNDALIDLFGLLSERNRTLTQTNQQLLAAKAELEMVNRSLESHVQARTQELSQANAALLAEQHALEASLAQLERTQSQLLQSEKMAAVGQLAAGVAHEINNPIGFVSSNISTLTQYSEQLLEVIDLSCQMASYLPHEPRLMLDSLLEKVEYDYLRRDLPDLLQESKDGLARVKRIVSDLRDFSTSDEGQRVAADLNAVLERALTMVAADLAGKVEVVRELASTLPPVWCVATQITQVLVNLLTNAAQAMTVPGRITLRSGFDEDDVWVEIVDTGCGMSEEVQKHIFDPFYTTKPVGQGTGLGLSLSWEIMQRHDGGLQVKSAPGVGSTFRVILPVSKKVDDV
jgi:two-component system, NtrC family, sensor kinase